MTRSLANTIISRVSEHIRENLGMIWNVLSSYTSMHPVDGFSVMVICRPVVGSVPSMAPAGS